MQRTSRERPQGRSPVTPRVSAGAAGAGRKVGLATCSPLTPAGCCALPCSDPVLLDPEPRRQDAAGQILHAAQRRRQEAGRGRGATPDCQPRRKVHQLPRGVLLGAGLRGGGGRGDARNAGFCVWTVRLAAPDRRRPPARPPAAPSTRCRPASAPPPAPPCSTRRTSLCTAVTPASTSSSAWTQATTSCSTWRPSTCLWRWVQAAACC